MARIINPLTATQVKEAKPSNKDRTLSDGGGLQLRIKPNGSKLWHFAYTRPIDKKRTLLSLGKYPATSLANARKLAASQHELLAQGIDPKKHRDNKNQELISLIENTVLNVSKRWFEVKRHQVSEHHAFDTWRSLEMYIFPYIGNTPLESITAPQVIEVLRPIEASGKLFVIGKVIQRFNEIMVFAVNTGVIHANPLAGIKAAFRKPDINNTPALTPKGLHLLISTVALSNIRVTTKNLINWQLHTMVRPSEAAATRWDEIDFENKVWVIPAERMKGTKNKKREHRVPLTPQMLSILENMHLISTHHDFVFPADRNPKNHTNVETANTALKRLGFQGKTTAHGLRTLASTTLNEQGFDADLIEAALAHVNRNQVRNIYNRTDYLERRRKMMAWWSLHIEEASQGNLSISGLKNLK